MLKRFIGKRTGSLALALGAALVIPFTPAFTGTSAAGNGPQQWQMPQWPQQWPQQWQAPQWPQQWQQQWQAPQWPQQWQQQQSLEQQWLQQQWLQPGPVQWPLYGPQQWKQQQWMLHPIGTLFDGLAYLEPRDISVTDWRGDPLLLWCNYPVTLVDVRSVLYDDEIDVLLDAIDYDRFASENADGLTWFLQDTGVLPDDVGVVGMDLLDGPPAAFVLPY